jgi:hypothetical protein
MGRRSSTRLAVTTSSIDRRRQNINPTQGRAGNVGNAFVRSTISRHQSGRQPFAARGRQRSFGRASDGIERKRQFIFPSSKLASYKAPREACDLHVNFEWIRILDMWLFRILVRLALTGTPRTSWYMTCYPWPTMPKRVGSGQASSTRYTEKCAPSSAEGRTRGET